MTDIYLISHHKCSIVVQSSYFQIRLNLYSLCENEFTVRYNSMTLFRALSPFFYADLIDLTKIAQIQSNQLPLVLF